MNRIKHQFKMRKIIIAGGSGFLGDCLVRHFVENGFQVVILTRQNQANQESINYCKWDAKNQGSWAKEMEGAEALINLTGKSVDCRYNEANKKLIMDSRIDSTKALGIAISQLINPPKVWINAASATIYRHALDKEMDEDTGDIGEGFSVDVCKNWEQTFTEIQVPTTRKVILRIAIVLGKNGGALIPLKNLAKIGLGGRQGKGNQFFSWLHEQDFVRIIDYVIQNVALEGIYNASAPNPITNTAVMKAIRKASGVFFGMPMPAWLLKIGAFLIRTEPELVLKSRRVVPARLLKSGFQFQFAHIDKALNDIL
jgi:uncharacterized protein